MNLYPVGFHTTLTEEAYKRILENVEGNYVVGQIARMSLVPRETLRRWLKRGEEEAMRNEETIFSQLWVNLEAKRGIEIKAMLEDVRSRKTNWQAVWELLKSIAREDFGQDSIEYKELLDQVTKLSEIVQRYIQNPLQHGARNHGREVDSKGN